jgi:hypothetical protein
LSGSLHHIGNVQHELYGSEALREIVARKGAKSQNKEKYKLIEIGF